MALIFPASIFPPQSCRADTRPPLRQSLSRPNRMTSAPGVVVKDYKSVDGWTQPTDPTARSRAYCQQLERGEILFFSEPPFDLPQSDREFLLAQQWAEMRLHKNVSYRPGADILKGIQGSSQAVERVHDIMRRYSTG